MDWGSFDLGNDRASFHWFKGKVGEYKGRKYNPVDFGKSETKTLNLVGGSRVQISKNNDIANPVSSKPATSPKPQSEGLANPKLANAIADRTESIPVATGGFAVVAGVAAGVVLTTAPALAAGSITSLGIDSLAATTSGAVTDVAVIGGLEATAAEYGGEVGFNILEQSAGYTWGGVNIPWLDSIISNGQVVLVKAGGPSTLKEAAYLLAAGYTRAGEYLVPPH